MNFTVKYVKHFRTGTLKGLDVPCLIGSFQTQDAAARYLSTSALFVGKKGADVITGAKWTLVSVGVVTV